MFNKDFYPTPDNVLAMMGFDSEGKVVLEPSAGSGNIIDYLKSQGAKRVIACEKSEKLAEIVKSKCDQFLAYDFLEVTKEDISHVELIVANPPFSNGVEHILHMWDIAPDGCQIYTLINHDNLEVRIPSRETRRLLGIIKTFGGSINLGACFDDAERKTGVEVGLISIFKPATEESGFEGFFMDDEHVSNEGYGIVRYDEIRNLVERYVDALKSFKDFEAIQSKMNMILEPIKVTPLTAKIYENGRDSELDYSSFASALQRKMWQHVFSKMNLGKFLTSKVRDRINKFSEQQQKVPFTMKNIYRMAEIIYGTSEQIMKDALVEAIDNLTMYTHENRYEVEGWKTNKGHLLGKKFIANGLRNTWSGLEIGWGSRIDDNLSDLVKVLCNLTATDFDSINRPCHWIEKDMSTNQWYDVKRKVKNGVNENGESLFTLEPIFFEFKFFKKGSIHIKFLDDKLWEILNRKYAEIKGNDLPEKI